jgi:hypothetical protein
MLVGGSLTQITHRIINVGVSYAAQVLNKSRQSPGTAEENKRLIDKMYSESKCQARCGERLVPPCPFQSWPIAVVTGEGEVSVQAEKATLTER